MNPPMSYTELLAHFCSLGRLPAGWQAILAAEGKSADAFLEDVGPRLAEPRRGDSCGRCGVPIVVYRSRRIGGTQVQWLRCPACHHRPPIGKRCVPAATIRRRRRKGLT